MIRNIKGIDKMRNELENIAMRAKRNKREQAMYYVDKVSAKYDELVDVFDTCQYLQMNGLGGGIFSSSANNGERILDCSGFIGGFHGAMLKLYSNKRVGIYMASNGCGMGESYTLSDTCSDDTIEKCMQTERSLNCQPYKERLDRLVAELPQMIAEFFEYVDSI